jgi:hypothetical protein
MRQTTLHNYKKQRTIITVCIFNFIFLYNSREGYISSAAWWYRAIESSRLRECDSDLLLQLSNTR